MRDGGVWVSDSREEGGLNLAHPSTHKRVHSTLVHREYNVDSQRERENEDRDKSCAGNGSPSLLQRDRTSVGAVMGRR